MTVPDRASIDEAALDIAPLDPERVRTDFPSLAFGTAHFDSPGGTQTPTPVIEAIADALRAPLANRGTRTPAERNADSIVRAARTAMADLLNAQPGGVVFGRSATALTFDVSRMLAAGRSGTDGTSEWRRGDEIVVSRLDHDSNIRPWLLAAERGGLVVRWAEFDPATGELPTRAVADLLSERTRLVAVTGASNLIGTRPDIPAIADLVHAAGALLYVDGVHLAAHALVDLAALRADFLVCSPYKFLGPHLGVLAAPPALLDTLRPDKLLPSSNAVPERFELGTLPYELLAGTTAAVDYLAGLAGGADRRQRLTRAYRLLDAHESALLSRLEGALAELDRVTVYSRAASRTSTVLFSVAGMTPGEVSDRLAERGLNAPAGSFYALEASRHLGLGDGGAVRVGLAPYSNADDVDRLVSALTELAG
ncbi:cysteine desulfurase-like protein [Microlunatus panaciterrae]|uniref:Cysteine desulfurase family protein (TIGR01976 family) n=1 Tax=Microlunatus panaciterrae TaxID=400768 RepID=A0ABS2RNJ1_9ACTN|nr:cysteine desulfurase family protein (TIGR01976 family) [Microlunatus panaciterrae]